MESELIYIKTATGEEAIRQRTRVIQRNMRMVLILVDGHSTVGEISHKTGNHQLTENALIELEKGGFVELRADDDSIWAESKKVAQEIRDSAIHKALAASASQVSPAQEKNVGAPTAVGNERAQIKSPVSSLSPASKTDQQISADLPPDSLPPKEERKSRKNSANVKNQSSRLPLLLILKVLFLKFKNNAGLFSLSKSVRSEHAGAAFKPMKIGLYLLCFLALCILGIMFFPYKTYIPEVEAAFSQAMGRPVHVDTMSVSFYPKPGILLGNVRVGQEKDEILIAELRLLPDLASLSAEKKILRDVTLSGVNLPIDRLALLAGFLSASGAPASPVGVKHLHLEKTEISLGELSLSGMDGEVTLSSEGLFQSLKLRSADRNVNLEIKPQARRFEVLFEGYAWRPVPGSPYVFETASLKGEIQNGLFAINAMELRIFDGLIEGVAVLQAGKKPGVAGEIKFERINASRFGDALGIGQQFSGDASGKIRFSMTADTWPSLFAAISAEGEFGIQRGKIRGIDLAEAVRRVSGAPVQGGVTNFEQLSGKLRLTPGRYQFTGLVMNSGLMQSSGAVEIGKDLMLNGRMELQMRGSVNQSRLPIAISGPLKSPIVQIVKR
jgi:hypothetical protein